MHNSYDGCLEMADRQGLHSIAFPCISTGDFCFPKLAASQIAFRACREWYDSFGILKCINLDTIRFVCFDDENYEIYKTLMPSGEYEEEFELEE